MRACRLVYYTQNILIEDNIFDKASGIVLLFCGDANGGEESGACQHVVIRRHTFNNYMTAFINYVRILFLYTLKFLILFTTKVL